MSTLALWAALAVAAPQQADVRAVSIRPEGETTVITIDVAGGAVSVRDYMLQAPARLVIDVVGARHALSSENYPGIGRGGVVGVRSSQYEANTVRLVFDLTEAVGYEVDQGPEGVRVMFQNPVGPFAAWSSSGGGMAVVQDPERMAPTSTPAGTAQRVAAPAFQEEPRITVTFEATPILDVLNTFAEFTGRSIIAGPGVTDITVNAEVRNQPWDVALQEILDANGLSIRETETGILRVDKTSDLAGRLEQEELITRSFRLNYVSVDTLLPAIQGLLSERGQATASTAANLIIVTDASSVVDRLSEVIARLDAPTPQVTIAAKIIFIDRTSLEDLGFIYDLKDLQTPTGGNQLNTIVDGVFDEDGDGIIEANERTDEDVILLGGNSIAALGNAGQRVGNPALRVVGSLVMGSHSLIGFLEALRELSLSDIQAEPVITTMDNREAEVLVGQATPIRVIDAAAGGGEGGFPVANVETRETGIILRVRPHVTGDQVYLQVHAERSNVVLAASDVGVVFQTQRSNTEVLLNDGETAVISGLTVIERTQSRAGIPVLMDLPFIGFLFRRTTEREVKQDLLIMVTPHIVKPGEA
jgi:type IV pilus assembly protein PilQ